MTTNELMETHFEQALRFGRRYGRGDEQFEGAAVDALIRVARKYMGHNCFVSILRQAVRTECHNLRAAQRRDAERQAAVAKRATYGPGHLGELIDAIAGPLAAIVRDVQAGYSSREAAARAGVGLRAARKVLHSVAHAVAA